MNRTFRPTDAQCLAFALVTCCVLCSALIWQATTPARADVLPIMWNLGLA